MRFLFVGRFTEVGGSALATIPLMVALRTAGHSVTLAHWVLPNSTDWFRDRDLLYLDLAHRGNLLQKIYHLTQLAAEADAIVAISELTPTYACQLAGWLTQRPVYGELQVHLDHWIQHSSAPIHHWLIRWFYPRLAGLRCVSQALEAYALHTLKVPQEKTFVVFNGFDLSAIQVQAAQPLPPALQPWFAGPVLLAVGRLVPQKRFDLAIQAFAIAQPQLPEGTRLVVVGDGPLREPLQHQIDHLGLGEAIHLAGRQPNPFALFAQATATLLSSDYEGFGRVLVEAMACGCPTIAHDCPVGPQEVLEEGRAGYLVQNNQPETLARAIVHLLNDPAQQQKYIQAGYRRSQTFDQPQISSQYLAILQQRIPGFTTPHPGKP